MEGHTPLQRKHCAEDHNDVRLTGRRECRDPSLSAITLLNSHIPYCQMSLLRMRHISCRMCRRNATAIGRDTTLSNLGGHWRT